MRIFTLGASCDLAEQLYLTVLPTSYMPMLWSSILTSIVGLGFGSGGGSSVVVKSRPAENLRELILNIKMF